MKNLKNLFLLACFWLIYIPIKADVIYSPGVNSGVVISLEGIASYELAFTKSNTLNLWGGGGMVFPVGEFFHPAYGTEIAMELRHYFTKNTFRKFNLGLYSGLAYMKTPELYGGRVVGHEPSVGFVPGLKLTYKQNVTQNIVAEPYVSLSVPFYNETIHGIFKDNSDGPFIVTLGVRLGFNQVQNLFKK